MCPLVPLPWTPPSRFISDTSCCYNILSVCKAVLLQIETFPLGGTREGDQGHKAHKRLTEPFLEAVSSKRGWAKKILVVQLPASCARIHSDEPRMSHHPGPSNPSPTLLQIIPLWSFTKLHGDATVCLVCQCAVWDKWKPSSHEKPHHFCLSHLMFLSGHWRFYI